MQNKTAPHAISPGHAIKQMPDHPKIMQVGPHAKANQRHDPSAQHPHQITITRNSCSLPLLFVCKEILNQFRISSTSQVPSCVTLLSPRSASAALRHAAHRETPPLRPSTRSSSSASARRPSPTRTTTPRSPTCASRRASSRSSSADQASEGHAPSRSVADIQVLRARRSEIGGPCAVAIEKCHRCGPTNTRRLSIAAHRERHPFQVLLIGLLFIN